MLAKGHRTAALTQMLSDPYFLQRRLALGSHRHLLHDLDVCQKELEEVIMRQRFEQRSTADDAALSRRHYLRKIRQFVEEEGAALEGPMHAKDLFKLLGNPDKQLSLGPASVVPLVLRFNSFVRASHKWLELIKNPHKRSFRVFLPLKYGAATNIAQREQSEEAAEGIRIELGRVLVVSAARLQVCLILQSPEMSEDFEGYFARVTIVANSEGRGAEPFDIAKQLMTMAMNPFSDLHMTESSTGANHLVWCTQVR